MCKISDVQRNKNDKSNLIRRPENDQKPQRQKKINSWIPWLMETDSIK